MTVNVSVLVDLISSSTHTNFNEEEIEDDEIVLAILHLFYMLYSHGVDIEDVMDSISEAIRDAREIDGEYEEPTMYLS